MKVVLCLTILSAAILPCLAQGTTVKVTYDALYNNPEYPMSDTACSNGVNGLGNKWPVLGDIPGFPFVGGIPGLTWNSTLCGSCWQLGYTTPDGYSNYLSMIAVDSAADSFNIAEEVFDIWAGSIGMEAGSVEATAVQLTPVDCGSDA